MIDRFTLFKFIHGARMYRMLISRIYGNYLNDGDGILHYDSPMATGYNLMLESFVEASINDKLDMLLDVAEQDEDFDLIKLDLIDDYIRYGYTYTVELDGDATSDEAPYVSNEAYLIETDDEFYDYWVLNKTPENKLLVTRGYDSQFAKAHEQKVAQQIYQQEFQHNFPNNEFVI